ncbi:MAK10-like protein [Tanacetum coccineum]
MSVLYFTASAKPTRLSIVFIYDCIETLNVDLVGVVLVRDVHLGDYSKPSYEGYRNTIELPEGNNVVPLRSDTIRLVQNGCSFHGLRSKDPNQNLKNFLKLVDSLDLDGENKERMRLRLFQFSLCDQASNWLERLPAGSISTWKDLATRFFAQFFPPRRTKKLRNDILIGPHDTQYCMEDPEQAFVEYASSQGLVSDFMASQDARLSKFESDFKQQQNEMTNKIDIVLKAITDQIAGTLRSDMEPEPTLEDEFKDLHLNLSVLEVPAHAPIFNDILDKYIESLELGKNGSAFVQGETPAKIGDPGLFTLPCRLGDSKPFNTLADLGSCVNIIPLYLFKKLNIGLLEETDHIFGLADKTKSYPVRIVKDIEVHIGKLKLLNGFYVLDMKKDPETPLLVGRGILATTKAVIDCRMAKIAVGEGITKLIFGVKGVDLDCHLPGEWEISRDVELNPFKDTRVFRRMVEFLGAIPINLKCNMWESEDLIKNLINWGKPPKNGDGALHAKIRLIDPNEEEFTKTLQSIPTTRNSPKEKVQERSSTWTTSTTLDV